jgi:hypothetical protein
MSLYNHPKYVPIKATPLDANTAIWALKEAWVKLFGDHISTEALCVLAAQSALETGRWQKINNYNFGNLKMLDDKSFTMFATGENIWNNNLKKTEYKWFEPPHIQTAFRSYDNPIDGAIDYLSFLSNRQSSEGWRNQAYKKAFEFLRQGKPKEFGYALHEAGYYTANPDVYTAGVVRLFDEFLRRKEELMSWIPEEHDTDPAPPPVSNPEHDTDLDVQTPAPAPVEEHDTEVDNPIPEVPEPEIPNVEPTKPVTIEPVKPVHGNEFVTLVALVITGLSALFAWLLGGF